jgi:hypothetical protein
VSTVAAVLGTSALALLAPGPAADAAPGSSCVISGSVSPTVVQRGENVTVTAAVQPSGGPCRAGSFEVTGGPFVLRTTDMFNGTGSCTIAFGAFDGLSAINVVLSTGQTQRIGTVTVLSPTPGTTRTVVRRTVTVTPPAAAASSAANASSRAAAAAVSASRAAATAVRTSTVTSTAFPGGSDTPSTPASGSAKDTPVADTASATGFSVNVRTVPTGGSSVPLLPLLIALLVLAGFVTAAGRFIYAHIHEELEV